MLHMVIEKKVTTIYRMCEFIEMLFLVLTK